MTEIILASASPRRKELLSNIGYSFTVHPSTLEEVMDPALSPGELVMALAQQKAEDVAQNYSASCVIGSDTVVVLDGEVLGKPADSQDAYRMLRSLSGRTHDVFTGVAIVHNGETSRFFVQTSVTFWELSDEEIHAYIDSREPFDKAGAYGIQKLGATLVQKIEGDYFAVVGLPVSRLSRELKHRDILPAY
ncbi:septum formation inhibitor Maf [Bacillus sp. HMF5848]|uniref:Maf family protein n=1 Tax=Bacillus sp. HMF5848 TaxID=2495421 RepID=UPI000F797F4C|nr:Maf family protein [Bacillus sp. HMF5848]RSK28017.1 septum formation inhibitor Maf [Bacillus sp. HMF5848]